MKRSAAAKLQGAIVSPFPGFVRPSLPTLGKEVPNSGNLIYEIKYDGYRAQAHKKDGRVTIYTRNGHDWTDRFASVTADIACLPAKELVLDGEIAVPGANGIPDFAALQKDAAARKSDRLLYYVFDLLYLDGYDLRKVPLLERKNLLSGLLKDSAQHRLQYVGYMMENGQAMFNGACEMGLEGIVCKRNAAYVSGRHSDWLKIKCNKTDIFYIVGYKPSRQGLAAIYLATQKEGVLKYAGRAGTGFSKKTAGELRGYFNLIATGTAPVPELEKRNVIYVHPALKAKIQYLEKTRTGLRNASFKELAGLDENLAQG